MMRRPPIRPLGILLWIVLAQGVFVPITRAGVDSWHDRSWDFTASTSWDWLGDAEPTTLKPQQLSAQDLALRETVEATLDELGLRHETQEDVDLYVAYRLVPPRPRGKPQVPRSRSGGTTMSVTLPNLGTKRSDNLLYLEIRDAFRNQPVWRGWFQPLAKRTVSSEDIRSAARRILERYPPQ